MVNVNAEGVFSGTACAIGALLEVPTNAAPRSTDSDSDVSGKYVCLQCDNTFKGTLGTITETKTNTPVAFENALTVIITCDQATDATKTNGVGFGYAKRFDNSQISWNSMFNYSGCPSSKTLVYHAKRTDNANVGGLPFEYTETSTYNMECVTTTKLNINGYSGVDANCAATVYKSNTTPVDVIEDETTTIVQCIACVHGFKATADATTGIVSNCTAIPNCNLTAPKRTLDTCYDNPNPYTATANGNYWAVNFDTVHGSAMADCEVVDTNSKCLMCKVGFQPAHDGLSCIEMTTSNTGCAAVGAGPNNLVKPDITDTITAMGNEVKQFVTFMQNRRKVASFESTYGAHHSLLCVDTCTSGKLLSFPNPGSIRRVCGKNLSSPAVTTIAGCSKPNESAAGCGTCESPSTHIPNTTVDECVEKSTKPNCTAVSGSQKDCTACDAGFTVSSGACVENFCEVIDPSSSACLVCKANSRPHASDNWRCEAPVTADLTHECEYWDGGKSNANLCVKCRDANTIPYVFNNSNTYSSSCQPWTKGNAEGGYIHPYTYVYFGVGSGTFSYQVITVRVVPDWVKREYHAFTSGGITAENACMKQRTDANCATFIENMYCSSCNPSHYLDLSNNTCVENTINNCETSAANANECTKCTDNFFLADSTTCTQRTLSTDCEVSDRNLTLDKCTACGNIDKWFKSATGTCEAYTATNCDNKSSTEDKCVTCVQKFWADSSSGSLVCTAVTSVDNCKTYSTTANKCTHCNDNAWFDDVTTPGTPACPLRTEIEFCTATPTDSDSCTTCEGDRYYNSSAKECRDYPVGVANCAIYEYPKTCVLCDSGYFLSSGTCSAVTTAVEGCSIHSSATACGTCTPGTHIANGAACDLITQKTGCVTYSDKDTCSACSGNYFLENGACTASGITGCTEAVKGTPNTCTTCDAGRYLSSDKTSCTAGTSVAGCAVYKDQTTCETCSTGKIKNADGTKCDSLTSQAGANCSMASTLAEPACDVCMYGYQKDSEGKCAAVSISNCLIDDGAGKCVLCKPAAFWMNKEGACEAVPEPPCEGDDCGQDIMKLSFTFMLAFFILRLF